MPPSFNMVGGLGSLHIARQVGLGPNGLWSGGFKNHDTHNDTVF